MKLAVIPARGGSKRIPRKNIKLFGGKPMIAWSIEAAQASGCFDEIIVSTDDAEIAEVARSHGARTPFMRPAALSDDLTPTTPVIAHATNFAIESGWAPDSVCCIYATAPFIHGADLREAHDMLLSSAADFVFSVTPYAAPIQRALRVAQDKGVSMFDEAQFLKRSQDLEEAYHDAGQFYWGTTPAWCAEKPVFSSNALGFVLPRYRVQDIDTPDDWQRAELMHHALSQMTTDASK